MSTHRAHRAIRKATGKYREVRGYLVAFPNSPKMALNPFKFRVSIASYPQGYRFESCPRSQLPLPSQVANPLRAWVFCCSASRAPSCYLGQNMDRLQLSNGFLTGFDTCYFSVTVCLAVSLFVGLRRLLGVLVSLPLVAWFGAPATGCAVVSVTPPTSLAHPQLAEW